MPDFLFKAFLEETLIRNIIITLYSNPLNKKRRLLYLKTQSVRRSKHLFISVIKNQSVHAVSGTIHCLFSDKYITHKYSVGITYNC